MIALKEARKRAGLTQRQASELSGVPLGTLRRWEQGVNDPDSDYIVQFADLYGVSTDELLGSSFAPVRERTMVDGEAELVELYRAMDEGKRAALLNVARAM